MHYAIDISRARTGDWDATTGLRAIDPTRVWIYRFGNRDVRDTWTKIDVPNRMAVSEEIALDYVRQEWPPLARRWDDDFAMGAPMGGEVRA